MPFGDKKDTRRGSFALLCMKDTPENARRDWKGIKVGTHGEVLDYKVRADRGVIDIGHKEEMRGDNKHGVEKREYHLERHVYLHSDRDHDKITGRVYSKAPLMSTAFQLGAREIHTYVIEDNDFRKLIEAAGVKVVLLGNNGTAPKEPKPIVEKPPKPKKEKSKQEPKESIKERFNRAGKKGK